MSGLNRVFGLSKCPNFKQVGLQAKRFTQHKSRCLFQYLHTPPCWQEWEEQSSVLVSQSRPCQPGGQEQDTCRRQEEEEDKVASREDTEEDAVGRTWKRMQ